LAAHVPVIEPPEANAFKEMGVSTRLAPLANPESVPVIEMMSPLPPIAPDMVPVSVLAPSVFVIVPVTEDPDWVRFNVHVSVTPRL
jgi:hypothetical protein